MNVPSQNVIERVISFVSPTWGMKRMQSKIVMNALYDTGGYITPQTSGRRSMRGWHPQPLSADADTILKLTGSRAAVRDLMMNTPIAGAALARELTNVAGWGLALQSRVDRDILGLTDDDANTWEHTVEREFKLWSRHCDAYRTNTFQELQQLALYNTSLSGDVFVLLLQISRPETPYTLNVKLIEADYVSNPNWAMDTGRLAGGIEVDDQGAPIIYNFWTPLMDTPIAIQTFNVGGKWIPVSAYGKESGRPNVLHLFHRERCMQRRGMPMLAPVVEILKQISRLSESELMAAVVSSFFTVFLKKQAGAGGLAPSFIPGENLTATPPSEQNLTYEMGHGSIIEMTEGQDITLADPKRPNQAFAPFFISLVQQIGARIEIPFEQLMLYFSSSYSAARGAIEEAWKFYRRRRQWLVTRFCQPVYEEWLTDAILIGRVTAPGFFDDPLIKQAWCGTYWGGPGKGQLNPLQETQASRARISGYLSTYEDEYTSIHGGADWTGALNRIARETALIKEKGLSIPGDMYQKSGAQAADEALPPPKPDAGGGDDGSQDENGGSGD